MVGLPIFAILYLLALLPIGLAIFRFIFELDADIYEWKEMRAAGVGMEYILFRASSRAKTVCGSMYLYSIPSGIGEKIYLWAANRYVE
jgi:hypothetical protein